MTTQIYIIQIITKMENPGISELACDITLTADCASGKKIKRTLTGMGSGKTEK